MSDYAYEQREMDEYHRQLTAPDKHSLSERKESCAMFLEAMKNDPALVAERIGWLFNGSYGYGSMKAAARIRKAGGRTNKCAQLTHIIAAIEWHCPMRMAAAAWKKLSASEKAALDAAVKAEIRDEDKYVREEGER